WAMGLRVCRAGGVDPPGTGRGLLRALASFVVIEAGTLLAFSVMALGLTFIDASQSVAALPLFMSFVLLVQILGFLLGVGLTCSTMRTRNGYRGLHEFASGTRVLELAPRKRRRRCFTGSAFNMPLFRPEGMPQEVERFEIDGAVRWQAEDRAFVG